jgi:hypothetical protein
MRKLFWILSSFIFVSGFILLSIALTNNSPDNQLKKYGLVIGLFLFFLSFVFRVIYRKLYK